MYIDTKNFPIFQIVASGVIKKLNEEEYIDRNTYLNLLNANNMKETNEETLKNNINVIETLNQKYDIFSEREFYSLWVINYYLLNKDK